MPSWVIDWRKESDRSFLFMEQSGRGYCRLQRSVEIANTWISEQTDISKGLDNRLWDIGVRFPENPRLLHCKGVQLTGFDDCLCGILREDLTTDFCQRSIDKPTSENVLQLLVE